MNSKRKNQFFIAFIYILTLYLNIKTVDSDVILLIDLWNYSNPSGSLYNGLCCDSSISTNCALLPPRCDITVKICIDSTENANQLGNPNSCSYGFNILYSMENMNTFNFKQNGQAASPFIFSIAWNKPSMPRFYIKFFAIDDDSERSLIFIADQSKLIDYYVVDYNANQNIIPTDGSSTQLNWLEFPLIYAIKCNTNYYTPSCNVRCVEQNSCTGGHYTCHPVTGAKICNFGFVDPSTDCVIRNTSVQLCSLSDTEFCSNNGFCYLNTIKSNSTTQAITLPICCCKRGLGGPNCNEIISCEMNPCLNGGFCLLNPTTNYGYCNCKLGFTGKYCDKKIECPINYYSDDCSVKCVAVDSCELHQECDYYGRLKCKDGWGSFPECNIRLINPNIDYECPIISNFSLSTSPCFNGGSCWKQTCCCPPGYTGLKCEKFIDLCQPSPCLNGGQCISSPNSFICKCKPGYSGIYCQNFIDPCRNSSLQCSGSGVCIPLSDYSGFNCSCLDGYTGVYCEKQIDYCSSKPCLNDGTCVSLFRNYYCTCSPGFTGLNCEKPVNFCASNPCINGQCYVLVNDYVCNCNPGWTNLKTCNDDINECDLVSPCFNNGTCVNLPGSFKCNCRLGFTGQFCQDRIDFCASNVCILPQTLTCQNNYLTNDFKCICKSGFTGSRCEIPVDYCASSPCIQNQYEKCVSYQTSYNCICKPGYLGVNCEIENNDCEPNPCFNNGICIDQINGFKCLCPVGFSGPTCLTNINPCQINLTLCGPNGKCYPQYTNTNNSGYFCQCSSGYQGTNCEITTSKCNSFKPCYNGATCVDLSPTNFTCICPSSYTGTYCERFIDPCLQGASLCNSGTCLNQPNGLNNFTCLCPSGYTGTYCQNLINPCIPNPCVQNQGFCQQLILVNGTRSFQCICVTGYTGKLCETLIDQCSNKPCKNNATCISLNGFYKCECPSNYYGSNCEYFYQCSSNPCDKIGTVYCIDLSPSEPINYKCNCRLGFTGLNCEININECSSHPCQNAGTCVDLIYSYYCKCKSNYVGTNCETPYNFCQVNQCAVGSTCVNLENTFKCLCPPTKTGVLCTDNIDLCSTLPCRNSGSCANLGSDYFCTCSPGYTGKNCSDVIDQCALQLVNGGVDSCQNGATCIGYINGFYCQCSSKFTGKYCQTPIDFCNSANTVICLNGGSCISLADGFKCQCANGYTGSRCDSFVDLCNSTICKNNGLCRTFLNGTIFCACPVGYTGYLCETPINRCDSFPCLNGGLCLNLPDNFICNCPINYFGSLCQEKRNFCSSFPCRNNGTCLDGLNGFSCVCPIGFIGDICQKSSLKYAGQTCATSPCKYGSCIDTSNGFVCVCRAGYTGNQCQDEIDICKIGINAESICLNNGTCINTLNNSPNYTYGFMCICQPGFNGNRCEYMTNPCASQPCARGVCINSGVSEYKCKCPLGFTGVNCETDINECLDSTKVICYNNSTCINTIGGYICRCLTGFTGQFCELSLDNCYSNPCYNDALCLNDLGSSFQCLCQPGFAGVLCEKIIDPCESKPCINQGTCISSQSHPNYFYCVCKPGITGKICEQLVDPCLNKPCLNNGICINRSTYNSTESFFCACPLGFTGENCETSLDPCKTQVRCINGGSCLVTGLYDFKCICPNGFTGVNCEIRDSCVSSPCLNGGLCTLVLPNGYQCNCPSNFTGINCNQSSTLCDPNPCFNLGICSIKNNTFSCFCFPGYSGPKCETYSGCKPECVYGRCVKQANNTDKCECIPGYTGPACDIDIKECASNPCLNNSTCSEPFINMFLCNCQQGYQGSRCETLIQVCDSRPCLNGGLCSQTSPNCFSCTCPPGYTGKVCELQLNQCNSLPCKNGAECVNGLNKYTCKCLPGTEGINCEIDSNECSSNPCKNNAQCITPQLNMYQCICLTGFSGINCEKPSNTCANNPCKNNGICALIPPNMFRCICSTGFYGQFCQDTVDPCSYQNCVRNFTGQILNVYGQPGKIRFDTYRACILNAWSSLNPSFELNPFNTVLTVESMQNALEFTDKLFANRVTSLRYTLTIKNIPPSYNFVIPSAQDYKNCCPLVVTCSVTYYNQYWDVNVCGMFSAADAQINMIRDALSVAWRRRNLDIVANCSCLYVDIFDNLIQYYDNNLGQKVTQIFYLVYANSPKLILEKGSNISPNRIPNDLEINNALRDKGLISCQSQILPPIIFSINICGCYAKRSLSSIVSFLIQAWSSDPSNGGIGYNNDINIIVQDVIELIPDNNYKTNYYSVQIKYLVTVNNKYIDRGFTYPYNYASILKTFEFLSKDTSLCSTVNPAVYAFFIITKNKMCDLVITQIENIIANWYYTLYNLPVGTILTVNIPKYGIEELVDDYSNIYFRIPVLIKVNDAYIVPNDNLYYLLREKFKTINIRPITVSNETFTVIDPVVIKTYRTVNAFSFYFSAKIPRNSINLISEYIRQAFESTNKSYSNSQISIKLQQYNILNSKSDASIIVNRLVAFISNSNGNLYDSRDENINQITNNLINLINNQNGLIINGNKLLVYDYSYICQFNILKYSDLFVFYLTNKHLSINQNDIVKISSWLNEQWNIILKNSFYSILVINNELYFENGNMIIGVNYLVRNQDPWCFDVNYININLENSFNKDLVPILCQSDYKFYRYQGPRPNKYFYSLELIGEVSEREPKFFNWIQFSLFNAWSKVYRNFNITTPQLSNKFQPRIGSLAVATTRIFYVLSLNGKLALNYFDSAPDGSIIENEFRPLGSDLRVYPKYDSITKSLLSSLYIQSTSLTPSIRTTLESNIDNSIQNLKYLAISNSYKLNKSVNILYDELYYGQSTKINVTRLYYSYYINGQLIYPCELVDLYAQNVYVIPTDRPFDYLIKSRYLNLILPTSNIVIDINQFIIGLQCTWYEKNKDILTGFNITAYEIKLSDSYFYASIFKDIIQRVYYFITINGVNVNEHPMNYQEPTIEDFNNVVKAFVTVSYYFPNKAYRVYLNGDSTQNDRNVLQTVLKSIWQKPNSLYNYATSDFNIYFNGNQTRFYDQKNKYQHLTRLIYRNLISNYADQNNLFNLMPDQETIRASYDQNKINYCNSSCLVSSFYDFYTLKNLTYDEAKQLIDKLKLAWYKQNLKENDPNFQSALSMAIYSILTYELPNGGLFYRVIYSVGLDLYEKLMDNSDYTDPTDFIYNSTLGIVVPRENYIQNLNPNQSSSLIVDKVTELTWWMILIIVIAAILLAILFIFIIFAIGSRRTTNENKSMLYSSESSLNLTNKTKNYDESFNRSTSSNNFRYYISDTPNYYNHNLNDDSEQQHQIQQTVTSTKTLNYKTNNDYSIRSTTNRKKNTKKFIELTVIDDTDTDSMKLNLPQQYEAKIN